MRQRGTGPRGLLGHICMAIAIVVGTGWFLLIFKTISTPSVAHLRWANPTSTAFMRAQGFKDTRHRWVKLSHISPLLRRAVIIAEDDLFFSHKGINWRALKGAAEMNLKRGRFSHGGSTITMQLARNLFLTPHKSLWRKAREITIALKLERELPKERILELYLNVVEWGEGIYGAGAAARHYFNKHPNALSMSEAAFLAAILPNPQDYGRHPEGTYLQKRIADIESRLTPEEPAQKDPIIPKGRSGPS
jgi:monofunctional biosynthetic peptidoglycan transglycosylase